MTGVYSRHRLVSAHVEALKLRLCEVSELGDSQPPGGPGQVVLLVLLQVLREDGKSSILLCPVEISNH